MQYIIFYNVTKFCVERIKSGRDESKLVPTLRHNPINRCLVSNFFLSCILKLWANRIKTFLRISIRKSM